MKMVGISENNLHSDIPKLRRRQRLHGRLGPDRDKSRRRDDAMGSDEVSSPSESAGKLSLYSKHGEWYYCIKANVLVQYRHYEL